MMELALEIPRIKWEKQRNLGLDKGFRDALRDYCKHRWPHHTAKYAAREFNLSVDQGRAVANGSAGLTTVEKCIKEGGPQVGVPVLEQVMGVQLAGLFRQAFLTDLASEAADAVEHEQRAATAYRRLAAGPAASGPDGRSWPRTGTVGAHPTRRVAD